MQTIDHPQPPSTPQTTLPSPIEDTFDSAEKGTKQQDPNVLNADVVAFMPSSLRVQRKPVQQPKRPRTVVHHNTAPPPQVKKAKAPDECDKFLEEISLL
jgi:hypothetical protein